MNELLVKKNKKVIYANTAWHYVSKILADLRVLFPFSYRIYFGLVE